MTVLIDTLPVCRDDLVIRCTGEGEYVVKRPITGTYFQIGEVEHFLLTHLNGKNSVEVICREFLNRFNDPIGNDDLNEFINEVQPLGLFAEPVSSTTSENESSDSLTSETSSVPSKTATASRSGGNVLFYRRSLFDPNDLLTVLERPLRSLWTRGFFLVSAFMIVMALLIVWENRNDLVSRFPESMHWETAVLFWATLVTVTMLHEFAHGLTCKHYGGEVHEIGVLFIFFTPCFYANVTDAWLIPKKAHRLWVTLAGTYCDLCLWTLAVFVWRITVQDSLINYMAWIVISICGGRILLNFNPLLRLDGYYLLGDWLEIPNLRQRSSESWMAHVQWVLWGAERPATQPRGATLLIYGMATWLFSLFFLNVVIYGVFQFLGGQSGVMGMIITVVLLSVASRQVFQGFFSDEVGKMIATRPKRTALWLFGLASVLTFVFAVPLNYQANGDFEIRPGTRIEIHAPVAGFVKAMYHGEGDIVEQDTLIAELEVPDLLSHITRKQSEIQEVEAALKRLKTGPRPEEVAEQKRRVERAESWRDMAQRDLDKSRESLKQELIRLDHLIQQSETEVKYNVVSVNRAAKLYSARALAGEQYRSEYKRYELSASQYAQAKAAKLARESEGVRTSEAEVSRREKELDDAKSVLTLMQAGSRPEDVEVETARRTKLLEELTFLQNQVGRLKIKSTGSGIISTPRMHDRIGQLAEMGSLLCLVENNSTMDVEIAVAEEDVAGIKIGQTIDLKARALPFDKFVAKVDRIAPTAIGSMDRRLSQNRVIVYCHVDNADGKLKSGMTGIARIYRGQRSLGLSLINKGLRYLRTEFWW